MTESEESAADGATETDATAEESKPKPLQTGEIIAPPSSWHRGKLMIIALVFVGMGGYFLYDGFVGYPKENHEQVSQGKAPAHSETDMRLQKIIGYALVPIGVLLLIRAHLTTRGQYQLTADDTLHVPGHPPVPVDAIREIDEAKWDRKGIAYITYELNGKTAKIKLDDFAYLQDPTDAIHDRLVAAISPPATEA